MFDSLAIWALALIFIGSAAVVWIAGVQLSNTVDVIDHRLGIGEALGGLIILAIVTNLPEIAITVSAALKNDLGIAVGNILGGIAIQTVVLAVLDLFGLWKVDTLTHRAASLVLVIEGLMVLAMLVTVVMGTQFLPAATHAGLEPAALMLVGMWFVSILLVSRARTALPWHGDGVPVDGQPEPRGHAKKQKSARAHERGHTMPIVWTVFSVSALVTLVGGVLLERSGEQLATHLGMSGVLFGATVLATATALPEISTGLTSVRLGDYQMAVSDIFGGNAFLPTLFLVASVVSGHAVLPSAHASDLYLTGLGALLTVIYATGLLFRPRKLYLNMGIDSLLVVIAYVVGIVGLIWVGSG